MVTKLTGRLTFEPGVGAVNTGKICNINQCLNHNNAFHRLLINNTDVEQFICATIQSRDLLWFVHTYCNCTVVATSGKTSNTVLFCENNFFNFESEVSKQAMNRALFTHIQTWHINWTCAPTSIPMFKQKTVRSGHQLVSRQANLGSFIHSYIPDCKSLLIDCFGAHSMLYLQHCETVRFDLAGWRPACPPRLLQGLSSCCGLRRCVCSSVARRRGWSLPPRCGAAACWTLSRKRTAAVSRPKGPPPLHWGSPRSRLCGQREWHTPGVRGDVFCPGDRVLWVKYPNAQ